MLIAPTEPPLLKRLGTVSLTPEAMGVDVLWVASGEEGPPLRIGIQRKAFPGDFLSSLQDGRLQKELAQMASLDHAFLILEGLGSWTGDGALLLPHSSRQVTRRHMFGFLASLQSQYRVGWLQTSDLSDTCEAVVALREWFQKPNHLSLTSRPKPVAPWGSAHSPEWRAWFWQGFPGVGPGTAANLAAAFDPLPFTFTHPSADLRAVKGVGKKRAGEILALLEDPGR